MNTRKIIPGAPPNNLNNLVDRWAPRIVACSLLLVVMTTLYPFNFSYKDSFSIQTIAGSFNHQPSNLIDILRNIVLFVPFGFGFTCLMYKARRKGITVLAAVLAASSGLSFTVEVLQVFLPSRSPSLTDILTNSTGGVLGFVCFCLWRVQVLNYISNPVEKSKGHLSARKLAAGFIGYVLLTFVMAIALQNTTNLGNWDPTFPLLLGNEATGDRPWQGSVSQVAITNKALSETEIARAFSDKHSLIAGRDSLLAAYQLTSQADSYSDQTTHLPDLSWRGEPEKAQDGQGVFLAPSHWLETAGPTPFLTQKIRETSQFTLSVTVATADPRQTGPARIVSLSADPFRRNFTLGQGGADLVFRLRTPITGENGAEPELIVPGIFLDTHPHHLIITYNGSVIQFYVDQIRYLYSLNLNPEITSFRYLLLPFDSWSIRITAFNLMIYKILYYGLVFIPLGFLLALITMILRGQFAFYALLIVGGILLPALILEGILASGSARGIRPENLLLSTTIMVGTMLVVKIWTASRLSRNSVP